MEISSFSKGELNENWIEVVFLLSIFPALLFISCGSSDGGGGESAPVMHVWVEVDSAYQELANNDASPLKFSKHGNYPDRYNLKITNEGSGDLAISNIILEEWPGHAFEETDFSLQDFPPFPEDIDDEDEELIFTIVFNNDGVARIKIETDEEDENNNPFFINLSGFC